MVGKGGKFLIGVDLKKDNNVLSNAYNDAQKITAQFNLNLLVRMQTELNAEIDITGFSHNAFYNEEQGRVEMHLVSERQQQILIDDEIINFDENESIRTECSYKYNLNEFANLANQSGFDVEQVWTDEKQLFSVQCLVVR